MDNKCTSLGIVFGSMFVPLVLVIMAGSIIAILTLTVMASVSPMTAYGAPVEAQFSQSQCYALSRASDFIQMVSEIDGSKKKTMQRFERILAQNGWRDANVQRFLWELSVMWGRSIDPRLVETTCMERGGKYEQGESVKYDETKRNS